MRICSPHCGVNPETTSGGEPYERELLVRLGRAGVRIEIILARGKPHPEGVPNWTIHRFPIGRGLRWYVAPFVVPAAVKRVYQASARVVVGSEFGKRQLASELGVRTDHVSVVYYGVDPAFVPRPPNADLIDRYGLRGHPVVLFFGGLKPRKNLFLLLDVWAPVASRRADARLVVAGGGPLLDDLRQHARRLGLEGRVVFTGYVPEVEKAEHFNLADVFLFPSAMEGFGFTVAEAMSSGVPVVASDRGSIPELVADGQSGFVCDPAAPERFVARLLLLLGDPAMREKLGAAGREGADRLFRWEPCVEAPRRVYEDTIEAWRRRGVRPRP